MENKEILDLTKAKYVATVKRDEKLLKTFVKFSNGVKHPRTTAYMVLLGATLTALPFVNKDIALVGDIICYVMGPILVLMGLLRHYIGVKMLKDNPGTNLGEELTYIFGNTDIKIQKNNEIEKLGSYAKVYRLWEDEKHFYIGINEDDLVVLPKADFESGEVATFRDYILEKSGAIFTWKPTRIDRVIKNAIIQLDMKLKRQAIEDDNEEEK